MVNIKSALYSGIGRRKCATAKAYLIPGIGKMNINNQQVLNYFNKNSYLVDIVNSPFHLLELTNKYDTIIYSNGGGLNGQAEAIRLAISRAICQLDPENRKILKPKGLLCSDSRHVERKKYGLKKARKASQYSKR